MGQLKYNPEADEISDEDLEFVSDFYGRLKADPEQLSPTWITIH